MKNSKKSLKDFQNVKVQKLQKDQKRKVKGGIVVDDVLGL